MKTNSWSVGPWVVGRFFFNRLVLILCCGLGMAAAGAQTHPIFVLNSLDASVSVIDPKTWQVTHQIQTGKSDVLVSAKLKKSYLT